MKNFNLSKPLKNAGLNRKSMIASGRSEIGSSTVSIKRHPLKINLNTLSYFLNMYCARRAVFLFEFETPSPPYIADFLVPENSFGSEIKFLALTSRGVTAIQTGSTRREKKIHLDTPLPRKY